MTISFPTDKTQPFLAENGVTYFWDTDRWRVKTYKKEADERLPYRIETDKVVRSGGTRMGPEIDLVDAQNNYSNIKFTGTNGVDVTSDIQGIIIDGDHLTTKAEFNKDQGEQDQLIAANRRSIEELEVTKGPVSRYECKGTSFLIASRDGDLYVNDADAANVTMVSFAPFDLNHNTTRPVNIGDIIEFVESKTTRNAGEVSRFRVVSGDNSSALEVVYLNGKNTFEVGETEEVYIYPQNTETASKEYVDTHFLPLAGGELTGSLRINRGDKPHAQWKIAPNSGTDYATNIYSLAGPVRFRSSHTGDEGDHQGSHIVLDPDADNAGANQTTKIYKIPTPNQPDMAASKEYVDAKVAAGGGSLPTASTGTKGGVKVATSGGTYVACTKMSGETIGVVESTNSARGVNYKGQACITNSSTPDASQYQQGALVFSTSTNSLFIRT